ncbi:hypothetical protein PEC301877_15720 [Pectobacterium carotovorum subsp. carotovorum]|nr:hypothetical protein PEC301877_15720 [Pectobacterium carotovorum subsp. carotovorum]
MFYEVEFLTDVIVVPVQHKFDEMTDGKWLVEIEGKTSVRDLTRIPIGKVRISGIGMVFDCLLTDIRLIAKDFMVILLS